MTAPGPLTLEDLERLERLAREATPAPWDVDDTDGEAYVCGGPLQSLVLIAGNRCYPHPQDLKNLHYLAALDPSTVLRLTAALRSVMAERDAALRERAMFRDGFEKAGARLTSERDDAREQVRSLTLERDAERETAQAERTRADETFSEKLGLIARLSRAREALASWDVCLSNGAGPPAVPTPEQINRASDAVAALRAALAEPLGGP